MQFLLKIAIICNTMSKMNFIKKIREIFKLGVRRVDKEAPPPEEVIRKSAIRRKLKNIGYKTDQIETVYSRKKKEKREPWENKE